ncbi:pentapeptide repeat-containing protein [Nocardia acidivorans]|uniref:pentapeptide repeat-containing protein n=1 Tax=Nocardia acidivorans TaxID=404580 RepID=UPI000A857176|nr:pentapeptide repeat-containing protein [Nocardia acidivorans]
MLNRTGHRSALLLSVLIAVVGGVAVGAFTWWMLWLALGAKAETPNQLDLVKIALGITAGVGAAVALVVAYRRQRDSERGRFAEVFGAAASQLGNTDVAVRIAGVYAMAGVADEFSARGRRQQCIDVLCGYLRLPYAPDEGASHLVSKSQRIEDAGTGVERIYHYRQNDRQVRETIVRVITERLRRSAEVSWSACDFDFSDAVFENADFRYAVFAGRSTRFTNASFTGGRETTFEGASFLGKRVSFRGAMFRGGSTSFEHVKFTHTRVERYERDTSGTTFADATFGGTVNFDNAVFGGARTEFTRTTFAGERSGFANARFTAELTAFERTVFDGDRVTFTGAEFSGARVIFTAARFYAGMTAFDCAQLGTATRWRSGRTDEVTFARAEYHGKVSFADAVFGGRLITFNGGDFFGEINFRRAAFDAREISFERPKAWVGVHCDWQGSSAAKPANIRPEQWPPIPAETPADTTT